ncbi:MAG: cytochrome-c peroxidase [Burkholderiaceae bacterium]|nr:cytochrome-c peroxidase [Burkholderiaceae bacterium]
MTQVGRVAILALAVMLPALLGFGWSQDGVTFRIDRWSSAEREVLASMSLDRLPPPPPDPSNAVADRPDAAALGRQLFVDTRLSRDGKVSCASCHDPQRQFQDDRPVGRGVGTGLRRTMPVPATAHGPWLFWDGRKDSLWSQALGPLEDGLEHGSNRTRLVQQLQAHHRADYEMVFGPFPMLAKLPADAGPLGTPEEREAWARLSEAQREAVNRVFANLGKAIGAYERTLSYGRSRFDRYVEAVQAGDRAGQQTLTRDEVQGLRLYIGKAQCATCHNGPLFSDQHFHNTGVPPRDAHSPDRGRALGLAKVQADEFNCLGRYSDAPAEACAELRFIAATDAGMEGAFKTPGLRNVALRPPYMHAGQLATLDEVVAHYRRSPAAATGRTELARDGASVANRQPIRLSDEEARQMVAFLRSLASPIVEPGTGRDAP